MIESDHFGVMRPFFLSLLEDMMQRLHDVDIEPTHLLMHPAIYREYWDAAQPEPEVVKISVPDEQREYTLHLCHDRARYVWEYAGRLYPVVQDPGTLTGQVTFWRGGECVGIVKDLVTRD